MHKSVLALIALLPTLMFVAPEAEARHPAYRNAPRVRIAVGIPGVNVRVGPWSMHYRPAPRPGYQWVAGYWEARTYYPGHWVPIGGPPQPGHIWVNGYWNGDTYVDGYWRAPRKRGHVWIDGYYHRGAWVVGGWAPDQQHAPTYEEPAYNDYQPETRQRSAPPADAPLALPPDYDSYEPEYQEPAPERQPQVFGSGRVRSESPTRPAEEAAPPADSIWGDPIEEEPLDEGSDEENIHHSLDW